MNKLQRYYTIANREALSIRFSNFRYNLKTNKMKRIFFISLIIIGISLTSCSSLKFTSTDKVKIKKPLPPNTASNPYSKRNN